MTKPKIKTKDLSKEELAGKIADAYLNLNSSIYEKLFNPLGQFPDVLEDRPELYFAYLMSRPEYFSFICREILNVHLAPFQGVILKNLWHHKFPMLIASRGAGKCITKDTIVFSDNGIFQVKNLLLDDLVPHQKYYFNNLNLLGENSFKKVEYGWYNGKTNTIKLTTNYGFELEGTYNHPLRVTDAENIVWKNLEDIKLNDWIIIDRSNNWFENFENKLEEDEGYLLGLIVGDGGYTIRGRIGFTTADVELERSIVKWSSKYFNKTFHKAKAKYQWVLCSVDIWDKLFQYYGFNSSECGKKEFPTSILKANKSVMKAFIQGIMDTDGSVDKRDGSIEYCAKSHEMCRMLQFVLTKFGIISKVKRRLNKKFQKYYSYLTIRGESARIFINKIGFRLSRKQSLAIQFQNKLNNPNKDIIPKELVLYRLERLKQLYIRNKDRKFWFDNGHLSSSRMRTYDVSYCVLDKILKSLEENEVNQNDKDYIFLKKLQHKHYFFDKVVKLTLQENDTYDFYIPDDHSFITNGFISHNSWLLAVYCLLRMMLLPGRKIIVTGAVFRQSKIVLDYIINIWDNAPLLRDMYRANRDGIIKNTDMWVFQLGNSDIKALPTGTGEKIRGMRAHDTIAEEFRCVHRNTLVQTDLGLMKIKDYISNDVSSVMNGENKFEVPDKIYITPKTDVYKITTDLGYSFKCSSIHQSMTSEGWKLAKDLVVGKDHLELDFNEYFPAENLKRNKTILDTNLAWLIGMWMSEGTNTYYNSINLTNTDFSLIPSYQTTCHDTKLRKDLAYWGIDYTTSHYKTIPWSILQSPRDVVVSFLSGLFEGAGSLFGVESHQQYACSYYSASEELIDVLQILLLKFGIMSAKNNKSSKWSNKHQWMLSIRAQESLEKLYNLLDVQKWKSKDKLEFIGSCDTQEEDNKLFGDYWFNTRKCIRVRSVEKLPEQEILYDFNIPKSHSFIGNGFIQHNSMNREIFETVIAGFGAVSNNPLDLVKSQAGKRLSKKLGMAIEEEENEFRRDNQLIISGTCDFAFNHFAEYWKRWNNIITSRGDKEKLSRLFEGKEIPENFNWKDYSIIRIPYDLLPNGFMDMGQLARSKATMLPELFNQEFGAIFVNDSTGFFRRSVIEKCVASPANSIDIPGYGTVIYNPVLRGKPDQRYVFAVDPASEQDKFSIIIIELHSNHRRIVYCWTTDKKDFRDKKQVGLIKESDFYAYCGRKIRELMILFPCEAIAIDSQGGGVAVMEVLHDKSRLQENEKPLWPVITDKSAYTDGEFGEHIIHIINFADANWTSEANHMLKKDFMDKTCLFPHVDAVEYALAAGQDEIQNRLYDTLEDCIFDINELKDELAIIVMTRTPNGRDKWDTPEIKLPNQKKGKLRKDRYSALVMANMVARTLQRTVPRSKFETEIGWARGKSDDVGGPLYVGPNRWAEALNLIY